LLSTVCLAAQGLGPQDAGQNPKARNLQVRGRVLGTDGVALAGVRVHIGDPGKVTTAEVLAMAGPTTAADGTFQLPWQWLPDAPWEEYALLVAQKGHASLRLWLQHQQLPAEGSSMPLDLGDLVLDKGQRFVGRLRGGDGKPVAGAIVTATDLVQERLGGMSTQVCSTRSNDAGIFDLPCAQPSGLALEVHAEGHYRLRRQPIAAGTPLELDLQPSGRIEGVVEHDGKPVPNAYIHATFETGGTETGRSDANGAFRLDVAYRGRWRLHAHVVQGQKPLQGDSKLGDGAAKGIVVALQSPSADDVERKLLVKAVAKGTGAPVRAFRAVAAWGENPAEPWLRHNLRAQIAQAKPATTGELAVGGPAEEGPAGVLYVVAKGHAPLLQKDVAWSSEQQTVTVELEPEASLTGTVRDPATGQPVAGAVVSAVEAGTPDWQPEPVPAAAEDLVKTAADGTFRLGELGEGEWLVHVRAEGRPGIEPMPVTLQKQEARTGLVFDAPAGGVVAGKLVGEPIGAGWRVSLEPVGGGQSFYGSPMHWGGGGRFFFTEFDDGVVSAAGTSQTVAADGSFRFTGVALGHYTLQLQLPRSPRAGQGLTLPIESFRVRAAGVQRDFDMQGDVVRSLRGRVTFPAAATAAENLVVIAEAAGSTDPWQHQGAPAGGRAAVGRDGTFAIAVVPGRYRLSVYDLQLGILVARTKAVTVKATDATCDIAVPLVAVTIECKPAASATMALFDRLELRAVLAADKEQGNAVDLDDQYDMGAGILLEPGATSVQLALPHGDFAVFARSQAMRLRVKDEGPSGSLGRVELSVPGDGKTAFAIEVAAPPTIAEADPVDEKPADEKGKDDGGR
ncbi:MAG: carboxypeptidase regulatory-like domain-containing protein, partial [Planctomycetes bacterium]|nr:carboxypeptidase regulatory-like domain-containing protein [Planctomycetota bacterium]